MSVRETCLAKKPNLPTSFGAQLLKPRVNKCGCGGTTSTEKNCEGCQKEQAPERSLLANPALLSSPSKNFSAGVFAHQPDLSNPWRLSAGKRGHDFGEIALYSKPAKSGNPHKAASEMDEDVEEEKPDPTAGGAASIKCNGSGDYEIIYGKYENATCGTKGCVTTHESSHIADWKAKWPTGCKDKAKGYLPKGDPPDNPLMTVVEYKAFLKQSECTAHTADLNCANALPKPEGCKDTVESYITLTTTQKAKWC